jgi:hypothetical protein
MKDEIRKMRCSFCIKELVLGYVNPNKDYKLCATCAFSDTGHPYYPFSENKGDFMLENPSFSDLIDFLCSFIHLKDECQQKLNEAIKNASNITLIKILKEGRSIPIYHKYCTYSEIFLLEDLATEELNNRGIDTVTFESRS